MTTSTHDPSMLPAWVACPLCRGPIQPVISELFSAYFEGIPITCPHCHTAIDWWKTLFQAARDHFMLTGAFHLLGCKTACVHATVLRGKTVTVDLVAAGVEPEAEILSLNFTPTGQIMPLRVHGNVPRDDPKEKRILLYGAALGEDSPEECTIHVSATWIVTADDEVAFRSLVAAARAYDLGRYDAAVVPANVAVESSIGNAMSDWLMSFCGKDRIEDFLSDGATYSHQLNVLLPVACHAVGLRPMPDSLRGLLNKLRSHRNDVAHRGKTESPLSKAFAAELLTAAVFGFHYARRLHNEVHRSQMNGRLPKPSERSR